jgi:[ribosomal protein S5]-alanine N-acetyltransferase
MQVTGIRLIDVDDAAALAAHLARDAEAFARWEPDRTPEFYTTDGQRDRIGRLLTEYKSGSAWPGVITAGAAGGPGNRVVGQVSVYAIQRGPFRKAMIGYWVATTDQGSGHATSAVAQVLDVMRDELGLHRAEACTQMDNLGSHQVLRRNGFVPHGIAHALIFINGQWRDEIMWERTLE